MQTRPLTVQPLQPAQPLQPIDAAARTSFVPGEGMDSGLQEWEEAAQEDLEPMDEIFSHYEANYR